MAGAFLIDDPRRRLERSKALPYNFLSALTFLVGAIIAYGASFAYDVTFLLPFASGNFIYIAAADLIPEINQHEDAQVNIVHFLVLGRLGLLWVVGVIFD